ncbi:hypothetical protein BKA03_002528 [Demequina lutea]|uniref:Uncharacterized protein n=1 Tax=Demequina lutea TaxID=431489 RepID=A0A7Y9ZBP1_9MICO|nr:hypothetical protein [Demequina lutea]
MTDNSLFAIEGVDRVCVTRPLPHLPWPRFAVATGGQVLGVVLARVATQAGQVMRAALKDLALRLHGRSRVKGGAPV